MAKWVCFGCSSSYGDLHGMWEMDFIEGDEEEALELARENAWHVCESYSEIYEPIEAEASESDDYSETYEELMLEEIEYMVFRLRDDADLEELYNLNWELQSILDEYGYGDA